MTPSLPSKRNLARILLVALACVTASAAIGRQAAPAEKSDAQAKPKKRIPYLQVTVPPGLEIPGPYSGRLTIYLKRDEARLPRDIGAGDGPHFDDPQPMFSMKVENLKEGDQIRFVDEVWSHFPLKDIPNGRYQAMAVLDREHNHSSWRKEETNLNSPYRYFEIKELRPGQDPPFVRFELVESSPTPLPIPPGMHKVELESSLLSAFHGRPVHLIAGVVQPVDYDPKREYPAVYWVHAFPSTRELTGDWRDAVFEAAPRQKNPRVKDPPEIHPLWRHAFYIALDAQGPFGHNLLADSDNNGPVARAIVEELIPAIEAKFPLIRRPEARVLRGHSSGAWTSVWLAVTRPETFGGAWASAPDPVDFRAFQATNIYEADSMFVGKDGKDTPSYRVGDEVRMTVRMENAMERVLGPEGDSAQQWCSWQAAFGPRDEKTRMPRPLFDIATGTIDKSVVERFKAYDIGAALRANPEKIGPIFRDRIRLIVGEKDNFYLNRAVELVRDELARHGMFQTRSAGKGGYVEIVPGADHGVASSPEATRAIWAEIEAHLRAAGLAQK